MRILIATSNAGKLRDFAAIAAEHGIEITALPGFHSLPEVVEDQPTFAGNARKKAEHYSRFAPGELVVADDSGLEVASLGGAPGVHSARYAAETPTQNSDDAANNARLLRELGDERDRTARFVCVLALARDGKTLTTFEGEARGQVLASPRGGGGFGYDPLFYFPALKKTFAEFTPAERARYGHRGAAFRRLAGEVKGTL